jgi:hypothetical protein
MEIQRAEKSPTSKVASVVGSTTGERKWALHVMTQQPGQAYKISQRVKLDQ